MPRRNDLDTSIDLTKGCRTSVGRSEAVVCAPAGCRTGRPPHAHFSIRELRASERSACDVFLNYLDPYDIRMRFAAPRIISCHHFLPGLSGTRQGLAFAAVAASKTILGIINFAYLSCDSAEVAVIVRSDCKRKGVGRSLLEHAIRRAEWDGLSRLVGHVLVENKAMLALAGVLGFQRNGRDGLLIEVSRPISLKRD